MYIQGLALYRCRGRHLRRWSSVTLLGRRVALYRMQHALEMRFSHGFRVVRCIVDKSSALNHNTISRRLVTDLRRIAAHVLLGRRRAVALAVACGRAAHDLRGRRLQPPNMWRQRSFTLELKTCFDECS